MTTLPAQISRRDDDLARSRLTVFFRFLLVLPHLVWLVLWTVAALLVGLVSWVATLIRGQQPDWAHRFFTAFLRYQVHLSAYMLYAANPFPGFVGAPGSYPVDAEYAPPERQNRWAVFFRFLLVYPALFLAGAVGASPLSIGLLPTVVAIFAWVVCLVRAAMPRGFQEAVVYGIGYYNQANAYLFLVTPRYPDSDPSRLPVEGPPELPVSLTVDDDFERSRLTVFFRLLLAIPHLIWLTLWGLVVYLVALAAWVAALFTGRVPEGLHNFMAAFVRYATHVGAYVYLAANPFPGFTGREGSYPVDVHIDGPVTQSRATIFFRLILDLPAYLVAFALANAIGTAAFLGWFAALFTGRMPRGLRNVIAWGLRYSAQFYSYGFLLTERYPYTGPGPLQRAPAEAPPEPAPPVPEAV